MASEPKLGGVAAAAYDALRPEVDALRARVERGEDAASLLCDELHAGIDGLTELRARVERLEGDNVQRWEIAEQRMAAAIARAEAAERERDIARRYQNNAVNNAVRLQDEKREAERKLAELTEAIDIDSYRDLPPDYPSRDDRLATLLRRLRAAFDRHARETGAQKTPAPQGGQTTPAEARPSSVAPQHVEDSLRQPSEGDAPLTAEQVSLAIRFVDDTGDYVESIKSGAALVERFAQQQVRTALQKQDIELCERQRVKVLAHEVDISNANAEALEKQLADRDAEIARLRGESIPPIAWSEVQAARAALGDK